MPTSSEAVRVEGLAELRRALGRIDKQLPKNLRAKLVPIGKRIADSARGRMPRRSGRAASSVSSGVSGNRAYVSIGKNTVPYAAWLDFGGTLRPSGGRRGTQVRPKVQGGRYLYPAIAANRGATEKAAAQALDDTARELRLK